MGPTTYYHLLSHTFRGLQALKSTTKQAQPNMIFIIASFTNKIYYSEKWALTYLPEKVTFKQQEACSSQILLFDS